MQTINSQILSDAPPLNAIIVENEQNSIENLKTMFRYSCKNVAVVGEGESLSSGFQLVQKNTNQIDFAFLDIHLDDGLSFSLIPELQEKGIDFLFVSAYPQHAAKAYKLDAAHFVTKPIDPDDLKEAVRRIQARKIFKVKSGEANIIISNKEGDFLVRISDILYCKGVNVYTLFYVKDRPKPIIISKNLGYFEEELKEYSNLYRSFTSDLINLDYVDYWKKEGTLNFIYMKNGDKLRLSRRRKKYFEELMKSRSER